MTFYTAQQRICLLLHLEFFWKKVGFFHEQDFRTLAKILLNITLPCAIIYSFSKVDFQISLLTVTVLSLFVGILMMFIAFFTSRMTGKKENIPFDILNLSGYNIWKFLPAVCTELFRAAQSSWHHII